MLIFIGNVTINSDTQKIIVNNEEFEFPISSNGFESSLTPGKINTISSIFENERKWNK